ncbi:MAG: hypothetical protein AB7I36_09315 [Rhodospirillaceae bacterium]
MKSYRCVVRSTAPPSSQTLYLTAADCRAAASTAVTALLNKDSDWIEVWHRDELVLKRRRSHVYPVSAAPGEKAFP